MTPRPARPIDHGTDAYDALVLRNPDALVAAIPYLLGFIPHESVIVLWIGERRLVLTQRLDLPGSRESVAPWLNAMWEHQGARMADEIVVVFVTDRDDVAGLCPAVIDRAESRGISVRDVLLLTHGRWSSVLCTDLTCCPAEGRPVDPAVRSSVAAEFTLVGIAPLATRERVAEALGPDPAAVAEAVAIWESLAPRPSAGPGLEAWRDEAIAAVMDVLKGDVDPEERGPRFVEMVSSLADIRVRDTVLWECARQDSVGLQSTLSVMVSAVRTAPVGHVAPVASTYAVIAWLAGDGARALMATERALADDPDYSLAQLVLASLQEGLPPKEWRAAMLAMPRAECRRG